MGIRVCSLPDRNGEINLLVTLTSSREYSSSRDGVAMVIFTFSSSTALG